MRFHNRYLSQIALLILAAIGIAGCGGGGGGGSGGLSLQLNTTSIEFTTQSYQPNGPSIQLLTGTLSGTTNGTLYVVIEAAGTGYTVSDVTISQNTGTIQVIPAAPATLGVGRYTGTITVTACLNDPTCQSGRIRGTPATVSVVYDILTTVKSATVSPYVVPTTGGETVVLRHPNLEGIEGVTIGALPATYNVVSATELRVDIPPLAAGEHTISVDVGVAVLPFRLVTVAPLGAPAATLPWPMGAPANLIYETLYDAERKALLVLAWNDGPAVNSLFRFAWNGSGWSAPTTSPVNDILDFALSPDGSRFVAITYNNVVELDPVTLATLRSTLKPGIEGGFSYDELHRLAIANDNLVVISSNMPGSGNTRMYLYQIGEPGVQRFLETSEDQGAYAPPDGSFVSAGALSFVGPYRYDASSGTFGFGQVVYTGFAVTRPSLDTHATRLLAGGTLQTPAGAILGTLPNNVTAGLLTRDGNRVYAFEEPDGQFQVYDASAPNGGALPALGAPVQLRQAGVSYSTTAGMAMTPAGDVAFVAEPEGIRVVPVGAQLTAGFEVRRMLPVMP